MLESENYGIMSSSCNPSTEKGFHVGLFKLVEVRTDVKRRCGDNFKNKTIIQHWWIFFKLFTSVFCKPTRKKYI